MHVLVLNCGSSSIKYRLLDMDTENVLASGLAERIDGDQGVLHHRFREAGGAMQETDRELSGSGHRAAFDAIRRAFADARDAGERIDVDAVGHRVVHGGEEFREPTRIDDEVLDAIRRNTSAGAVAQPGQSPRHRVAMELFGDVPQVAVFDTAFHQTLPPQAHLYAMPLRFHDELGVRRYGFHGTSFAYVSRRAIQHLGTDPERTNLIALHLGNGASACAIEGGRSVDTTMGMTPLEGLVMGTRCGDLDPAYPIPRARARADRRRDRPILHKKSGLLGLAGAHDMRVLLERLADGRRARRARDRRVLPPLKKYIGAYYAVLGRVDALVFTGGIGENSARIRARACAGLSRLGIELDPARNDRTDGDLAEVQRADGDVKVLVIRTNEELEIARQTVACVTRSS